MIGFTFESDWFRKKREFFGSITLRSKVKLRQSWSLLDTHTLGQNKRLYTAFSNMFDFDFLLEYLMFILACGYCVASHKT